MPSENRRRAQILDRCWSLYLWLTDTFNLPETFHIEFPAAAEATFLTGALQVVVPLTNQITFSLREEYALGGQELEISRYSYNVIDSNGNNVLRADNLPHHRTDYHGRALSHPPHHLHDERGRVRSFTGQVQDFIAAAKTLVGSS